MKVLKIKKSLNGKICWFNYLANRLENAPRYIVELTSTELLLLVETLKEKNKNG